MMASNLKHDPDAGGMWKPDAPPPPPASGASADPARSAASADPARSGASADPARSAASADGGGVFRVMWGLLAAWSVIVGGLFVAAIGGASGAPQEAAGAAMACAAVVVPYVFLRALDEANRAPRK